MECAGVSSVLPASFKGSSKVREVLSHMSPRPEDLWTEITKDLVVREAIEEFGYDLEETKYFYYVMQYLRYVSFSSRYINIILIA
jgi:hypothetical protein